MQVLNALDIKNGKTVSGNRLGITSQPIQFLPKHKKDEEWIADNVDWLEWQGIKQIRNNARKFLKNYKLAKGIIDKTDYIPAEDNEYVDLLDQLAKDEEIEALELKFFPIIPNVVNTLTTEFSKSNKRISFKTVDEYSMNELLELKRQQVESVLLQEAEQKLMLSLIEMGLDMENPEHQQEAQRVLSPENIKTLPEIENFFSKSYKSLAEEWASKQHAEDEQRFRLDELEEIAFRDSLIVDREFWHFRMLEDDYDVEIWNPITTFYHKSPNTKYISNGQYVGNIELFTLSDVLDKLGYLMNEEEIESLESIFPTRSAGLPIAGIPNDGSRWDPSLSVEKNRDASLAYKQFISMRENFGLTGDVIDEIYAESEDLYGFNNPDLLRVTTVYWKTQTKIGYLTRINEIGEVSTDFVSEDYKVTEKPIYDTTFQKTKNERNLLYGEHIEWLWINETYGATKVGPNKSTLYGMTKNSSECPVYLGVGKRKPGPLKFQFKGDHSVYGCKLPVEGCVFSDRNTISSSLVDMMKPFQIAYNIVNNQISDILIDEIGTVVLLDQNVLPKKSLGDDWGPNAYANAYVAMKDFSILPVDASMANTERSTTFNHYQTLNLEQTNRLMSRIQLANYFKQQAFEVVGITPQRLGQNIAQLDTARGVEQAIHASYAQTDGYFVQHSEQLMPRVHQMRTDLAQYYHSTKPSIRLQHINSNDERSFLELNGTNLLLRDINVYCTSLANQRAVLEQLKQIALSNNTTGASIYDLGNILQKDSLGSLNNTLKDIETKAQAQAEREREHQMQLAQEETERVLKEKQIELDHAAQEKEKDRRKDILVAEIRASGYGAMMDLNQNQQSDFQDAMQDIRKQEQYQDTVNLKRESESNKKAIAREKLDLEREKINAAKQKNLTDLEIAKTNKNKWDFVGKNSKKDDKKKK
jgi:hypothetical protein